MGIKYHFFMSALACVIVYGCFRFFTVHKKMFITSLYLDDQDVVAALTWPVDKTVNITKQINDCVADDKWFVFVPAVIALFSFPVVWILIPSWGAMATNTYALMLSAVLVSVCCVEKRYKWFLDIEPDVQQAVHVVIEQQQQQLQDTLQQYAKEIEQIEQQLKQISNRVNNKKH